MKTVKLKISEVKAKELYATASIEFRSLLEENFGKDFFDWNPIGSINDFMDVLNFHKITFEKFQSTCKGLAEDEIAYKVIKLVVAAYNNNELPDWGNKNQYKYYPWFYMVGSASGFSSDGYHFGLSRSTVGSRLVFLKKEHMLDAVKKFEGYYKRFFSHN